MPSPANTPRPTRSTTPRASSARCRRRTASPRAASRSATSSSSARNIRKPMGCQVARARRRPGHGADGLLRHRRVAPGRRHHRGLPRRGRHHLAGVGGAVRCRAHQPRAGPRAARSAPRPRCRTPYVNTIPPEEEPWFPGDEDIERRIRAFIRWNAAVMVVKANKHADGIGGHLATFASLGRALRGRLQPLLPRQGRRPRRRPHLLPGPRRARHLRPRLPRGPARPRSSSTTSAARSAATACPVYPHPRLMPDFWEYPTVSMGLGPLNSIYQARFNRYLHNRQHRRHQRRRGCGASSATASATSPRRSASISLAAREGLDNLTWVVNCNLQRLDGPVRGNGKIIQELEAVFRGAGLERHQGHLGLASGTSCSPRDVDGVLLNKMNDDRRRRVPALRRRVRRLHPRALLRPRPAAAQDGRAPLRRGAPQPAPRRARLPEALRRLQGRHRAARARPR